MLKHLHKKKTSRLIIRKLYKKKFNLYNFFQLSSSREYMIEMRKIPSLGRLASFKLGEFASQKLSIRHEL